MATASTEERQGARAQARWVRMSPRKARLVADNIRGRTVPEARTVLAFTQRGAARQVEQVLRSAVANAEANHGLVGEALVVSAAYVDEGPVIKRWRARAGPCRPDPQADLPHHDQARGRRRRDAARATDRSAPAASGSRGA